MQSGEAMIGIDERLVERGRLGAWLDRVDVAGVAVSRFSPIAGGMQNVLRRLLLIPRPRPEGQGMTALKDTGADSHAHPADGPDEARNRTIARLEYRTYRDAAA